MGLIYTDRHTHFQTKFFVFYWMGQFVNLNVESGILVTPAAAELLDPRVTPSVTAERKYVHPNLGKGVYWRYCRRLAPKIVVHQVRALRKIASAKDGPRNERLLAAALISVPPKRQANNVHGQTGTDRCSFCIKSKKKVLRSIIDIKIDV